jgi:surface protein
MADIFSAAEAINQDLSSWNVASVTVNGAEAFNQELSLWNVASVTDMAGMSIVMECCIGY